MFNHVSPRQIAKDAVGALRFMVRLRAAHIIATASAERVVNNPSPVTDFEIILAVMMSPYSYLLDAKNADVFSVVVFTGERSNEEATVPEINSTPPVDLTHSVEIIPGETYSARHRGAFQSCR